MAARLKERYEKELRSALMKELGFTNPMQAPRLEKIVVNMGLGEAISNGKIIDASLAQLTVIAGQKPVITKSRKSIANFKLRQGQSIGDAARRPHVRVLRPPRVGGAAPRP
jgi:large subunit ribosomal protein L5